MENISKGVRSKTQYIFAVLKLIPVGMEFHTSEILGFVNMALEKEGKGRYCTDSMLTRTMRGIHLCGVRIFDCVNVKNSVYRKIAEMPEYTVTQQRIKGRS